MGTQCKQAWATGVGITIASVPQAHTTMIMDPNSFFMAATLTLGSYRQTQSALFGQQKLPVGQTTRCEFFGQLLAAAGVAASTAQIPTTAANTIPKLNTFFLIEMSPREQGVIAAFGAPGSSSATREGEAPCRTDIVRLLCRVVRA
jgi:hypothetical protein